MTLSCDFLSSFIFNRSFFSMLAVLVSGVFQLLNSSVFVYCYALYRLSSVPAISCIFGTLQVVRSLNVLPSIFHCQLQYTVSLILNTVSQILYILKLAVATIVKKKSVDSLERKFLCTTLVLFK